MTRRPRGVNRHWFFHQERGYRREHLRCCIDTSWCPVCRATDGNCDDLCGCFARDPEAWRKALHERMVANDPEFALMEAAGPSKTTPSSEVSASKELK